VELLIVIVVIGILAAISFVSYNGITRQAAAVVLKSDLQQASTQLELELVTAGHYRSDEGGAAQGDWLSKSDGTNFQYTSDGTSYCLSATSTSAGSQTFHISDTSGTVQDGLCDGHTAPIAGGGNGTPPPLQPNQGVVTTLAGSGEPGFVNEIGVTAQFNNPHGVAIDSSRNVYVADSNNHRIRKITPSGEVSTLAGSGAAGFADGTGTAAKFRFPRGIAIDSSGTIYVADQINHRIRKITAEGVVTTLAGSGTAGFFDGASTDAQFSSPLGVAVDAAGNVYVADTSNHRIRKITPGGVVTTLAGSTQNHNNGTGAGASFNAPKDIAVDVDGNVYVADTNNNAIRKITADGVVTTLAGGSVGNGDGNGTNATFNRPGGVIVGTTGIIYVADTDNHRVRKITADGVVTTLAGSGRGYADGIATDAIFYSPGGVAVDNLGKVYVADTTNHRIRKIQ